MPGRRVVRRRSDTDTCLEINCRTRIPRLVEFGRYPLRRKLLIGFLFGVLIAFGLDVIRFVILGAIAANEGRPDPISTAILHDDLYFDAYDDGPEYHNQIIPDLPLVIPNDQMERQAIGLNETSPDYHDLSNRSTGANANKYFRNQSGLIESTTQTSSFAATRILCWVMTSPKTHLTRAIHVKRTWGKRCNILLFISSKNDSILNTTQVNVTEGRGNLAKKSKAAFEYVYDHYRDKADWFLKADDDTYVIVENLRHFLSFIDPLYPVYFGCRFKKYVRQGYMSGGAGYVLSKAALEYFVMYGIRDASAECDIRTPGGVEDIEMGMCLEAVGVIAGDSRDKRGSYRFLPFEADRHLNGYSQLLKSWYFDYIYYPQLKGLKCCSKSAISFHYVSPGSMYLMDYLLYRHKIMMDT